MFKLIYFHMYDEYFIKKRTPYPGQAISDRFMTDPDINVMFKNKTFSCSIQHIPKYYKDVVLFVSLNTM